MPEQTTVAQFNVSYLQFLDSDGNATQTLPDFASDNKTVLDCYRWMCLARHLDEKALSLQRTGKLGTYAQAIGQEAVMVGIGQAMQDDDILVPYYRDHGTCIQRHIDMSELLSYWGGDERGASFQNNQRDLPPCIPIATQALHAAGIATAVKYKKEKRAVLTTCGDGATSKGDFYEAMNIAGLWFLPMVFVINNNQWAISVPRSHQTGAQTLAQKGIAAGLNCLQVDGNDVIAVKYAVERALDKVRLGKGPTVIEAVTYRLCDHTSADDATRYQKQDEVQAARKLEPLIRTKAYLMQTQSWTETDDVQLHEDCKKQVEIAAQKYLNTPAPKVEDMFDCLFATLPDAIKAQREAAIAHAQQKEEHHD